MVVSTQFTSSTGIPSPMSISSLCWGSVLIYCVFACLHLIKKISKHQNIFVSDQYRDIIRSASSKTSVCINMENYFYDFAKFTFKLYFYKMPQTKKLILVTVKNRFEFEFGIYRYKTHLYEYTPFQLVNVRKKNLDKVGWRPSRLERKLEGLTIENWKIYRHKSSVSLKITDGVLRM